MKLQSKTKVNVKGKIFGGEEFLSSISIRAKDAKELVADTKEAISFKPDMVEWRIDCFNPVTGIDFNKEVDASVEKLVKALKEIKNILNDVPLLLCFRSFEEGGAAEVPDDFRLKMLEACMNTGLVDFIDVEADGNEKFTERAKATAKKNNVKLILSHVSFNSLQSEEQLINKAIEAQNKGADLIKLLYVGKDDVDVLMLAKASKRLKTENKIDVPFCAYVIGDVGVISRVMGDRHGADFGCCALRNEKLQIGFEESAKVYFDLRGYFANED